VPKRQEHPGPQPTLGHLGLSRDTFILLY